MIVCCSYCLLFSLLPWPIGAVCILLDSLMFVFFLFKQKTAYEMRISDWSSDVCSSDLKGYLERVVGSGIGFGSGVEYPKPLVNARLVQISTSKIGRASCRERVCQYV